MFPPIPRPRRIVVAEGTLTTLDTLVFLLSNRGYDVLPATNGREAFDLCRTRKPDLAVLAGELAELSGYEVYRRLRTGDDPCRIPVLLLTAATDSGDLPTRTLPDPEFLISKPFTAHDLLWRVAKALTPTPLLSWRP